MNFDDEQTKDSEKRFNENVESIQAFAKNGNLEVIGKELLKLQEIIQPLSAQPGKTDKELALLQKVRKALESIMHMIADMRSVLNEKATRDADLIYEHIKKRAEEGDEAAKKALEELTPLRRKAIEEDLSKN